MMNMLEQLNKLNFICIYCFIIINIDFFVEIQYIGAGDVVIKMKDGKIFCVSKFYKELLFK